jgi:hypothetical protein
VRVQAILFAAVVLAAAACGRASAEALAEARPAVERFLAGIDAGEIPAACATATPAFRAAAPEAKLRQVRDELAKVLGRRTRPGEPSAELSAAQPPGARALRVTWPTAYERGEVVVDVRATAAPGGPWLVDACVVRGAAFSWVFREAK